MSLPSRTHRPGILQEYPLDAFLRDCRLNSPVKSPTKRPASPALASPHKRRNIYPDAVPSPSCYRSLEFELAKGKYAAMHEEPSKAQAAMSALAGPPVDIHATPKRHPRSSSSSTLAPSPELHLSPSTKSARARAASDDDNDDAIQEFLASPARRPLQPPASVAAHVPMMIPRELPPSPDRASEHYPGFDIHRDTHIYLPRSSDFDRRPAPADMEVDDFKENVRAPRMRKAPTVTGSPLKNSITSLMSPGAKKKALEGGRKFQSMLASPKLASAAGLPADDATPVARKSGLVASPMSLAAGFDAPMRASPGKTPSQGEKRARRKMMMEEEVDMPEGDDEEL